MADAIDSATGVAAPLLGGFTLTLIALVVQDDKEFRWPGWTLLLLTLAVLLFITCVQAGFWARWRRPESIHSNLDSPHVLSSYRTWVRVARDTYDAAIILLFCGLGAILAPIDHHDEVQRWLAAGLFLGAAFSEAIWHFAARRTG
ncbi:hypothetical protein [Streptomyces sp. NBC_00564]|uniref:hypothetical protein n=1 Tax=Streptomyces sp. NBC_00564 TaxID=2903663 RepID=UPI00352E1EBA|nr:hypothetical protein OG256_31145 [Streptomyces sp. NBC_00564]